MAGANSASALEQFRAAVSGPDEQIDLVESALLVAQAEYPELDRAAYRKQLDAMGRDAAEEMRGGLLERLDRLNRLIFERLGFRGNREDYYDPRNSFLNDVLDRRTGIPITLAVVYIEIGRRAGLDLVGVGMPAHFLVGVVGHTDLHLDAFAEGALLTTGDCVARLRELRPDLKFRPEFLDPVDRRQILVRLLNNLFQIYYGASVYPKALAMLERISCLEPDEPEWLRQRAVVYYRLNNFTRAIADLETYLARVPDAPDHDELSKQLAVLQHLRSLVN